MRFTNEKLSDLTGKAKKLMISPVKKAIITTLVLATIPFYANPIVFAKDAKLSTDKYVYDNPAYNGTLSDTNTVSKQDKGQSYKDINLQLSSVEYLPEHFIHTKVEKQDENHKSVAELKANAAAIEIDGKPVVYLDSKSTAEDVIKKLKLQYVNEAQLNEFTARKPASADSVLPPLGQNQTRILDLHLSANVSIVEGKAESEQILPLEQAVGLLQKGTLATATYQVKEGDVLGTIASEHQLKIADLITLNPGLTENSVLNIGQVLNVTIPKPLLEVAVVKEVNQQEEIPFQTEVKEDANLANGETKIAQAGLTGLQNVTYQITEQNGTAIKKDITKQEVIRQSGNQIIIKGTKVIPSRGEGTFAWPAVGGYISSTMGYRWGKMHKGIDIARPGNLTIKAADNGVVVSAGWDNGGYGNKIVINHQNGYQTVYAHLSSIGVRAGQNVEKGTAIGVMGATGDATGVHLHFEVYKNGALQDPLEYVRR